MDKLVRQFAEKTPVHLLDKHRQLMRKIGNELCDTLVKSVFPTQTAYAQSGNLLLSLEVDCFMTGSVAEGANFARLFSPDSNTSSEFEFDVMISLAELLTEERLKYVDSNKAFVHLVVDWGVDNYSAILEQVRSFCGEEDVQKLFCQKEDGIYVSSQLIKFSFREQLTQWPNAFNNLSFRPSFADKKCDAGSASISVQIDDVINDQKLAETVGFESGEAQITGNANDAIFKLYKEMMPLCKEFEVKISEMLTRLQRVQDEFMEMRSEEHSVPLYSQASKALEWAMICVDITDVIFDTRKLTGCRFVDSIMNTDTQTSIEVPRAQIKQKLKFYIDQLAVSESDISNVSVAAAVCQLLSDIEHTDIASKRFLVSFREGARQQALFSNLITCMYQNPQLSQIPEPLQQLSESIKRCSVDIVPCFKLKLWPSVAAEWKTRDRVWPDQSVVDEIVSRGAHMVDKAFCHNDIDWRLSFSVAEIALATRWSPAQHFVYFVFKSLFYKFIKPLSSDNTADVSLSTSSHKYLASYMAKTVMMWTSESVEQSWWTEDNAAECLTVLLLALQSAFECRKLDHYFVSSVNLLKGLPDILARRAIDTVKSILADPAAVVDQLTSHFEKTEVYFNAIPAQMEAEKNLADFSKLMSLFTAFRPTM